MTAPFSTRNIADQLYSSMLASQLRSQVRLYGLDIALANEADAYELVCRDPAILSSLDQLCHEVAATGFRMIAGAKDGQSKRLASHFEQILENCNLSDAIYELAGYTFSGRAYAYPNGKRFYLSLSGGRPQSYWCPTHVQDIDPRRIIFVPRVKSLPNGRKVSVIKRQMADPYTAKYEDLDPRFEENLIEIKWGDTESRLGWGRGWMNAIFFYWRAKTLAVQNGLQGLERWAQGLLYGNMDLDRAGSPNNTNANLANDFLTKLKNMRSQHVAIFPKDAGEIKVAETNGQGHQIVAWFINYFDGQIARLILGAAMPTGAGESNGGAGSAGSEGKASVQAQATTRRILFHRKRIEECLNKSLIPTIYRANFPQFAAEGLGMAKMPRFKIQDEEHSDPLAVCEIVKAAQEAGMDDIPSAWFHEMTRIPVALEGEETLSKPVEPSPFGGGLPFGNDGANTPVPAQKGEDTRSKGPPDTYTDPPTITI